MKRIIAGLCSALLLLMTACQPVPDPSQTSESQIISNPPASGTIEPVKAVSYPKIVAYDDYEGQREQRELNPIDDAFVQQLNTFSYQTAAQVFKTTDGNANYSPMSLYLALALVATGASGETQSQLLTALGAADCDTLSKQCGNLYRRLYTDHSITKLKLANSLWMAKTFNGQPVSFQDSFIQNAVDQFYASTFLVDFHTDDVGSAMGKWISDNTNGTLSPTVKVSPEQILSVINTVYFNDQWSHQFNTNATAADVFHLSDGTDVTCDFLNGTFMSGSFVKGNGFTRAALGLKGGGSMVFVLPEQGSDMSQIISSPDTLSSMFESGEESYGELVFKAPKFKINSSFDLVETIQNLGVSNAFGLEADFSALSDQKLYISNINQETYISIDENGVEASAYTDIQLAGGAMPTERLELILNRPFLYGITTADGALLFIGICDNPIN